MYHEIIIWQSVRETRNAVEDWAIIQNILSIYRKTVLSSVSGEKGLPDIAIFQISNVMPNVCLSVSSSLMDRLSKFVT